MLTIILLAAGQSKRMGEADKLLLPFRGKTIVETTFENILAAGIASEIFMVVKPGWPCPAETPKQVKRVENPHFETGMTSSIQAGIRASEASESIGFMICLADMPFLQPADYQRIAFGFEEKFRGGDLRSIVQPVFENQRGNPVVFSKFYKNEILENKEPEGCKPIVLRNRQHLSLIEMPNPNVLSDIDWPHDLERV